jgi:hypothetical protein
MIGVNKFFIFDLYFLINSIDQPLDLYGILLTSYKSINLMVNFKKIGAKYKKQTNIDL